MTAPAGCQLIRRWRIVEADLWDRDYLDLVAPASITVGAGDHGEIAFGAMQAGLHLEYSPTMVFCTWAGLTKWTRSTVQAQPSCSTMDRSRSSSHITSVMTPYSEPNA